MNLFECREIKKGIGKYHDFQMVELPIFQQWVRWLRTAGQNRLIMVG
jgi:hypothetical protein